MIRWGPAPERTTGSKSDPPGEMLARLIVHSVPWGLDRLTHNNLGFSSNCLFRAASASGSGGVSDLLAWDFLTWNTSLARLKNHSSVSANCGCPVQVDASQVHR